MIDLDIFLEGVGRPVGRLEDRGGRLRYLDADLANRLSLSMPVR